MNLVRTLTAAIAFHAPRQIEQLAAEPELRQQSEGHVLHHAAELAGHGEARLPRIQRIETVFITLAMKST